MVCECVQRCVFSGVSVCVCSKVRVQRCERVCVFKGVFSGVVVVVVCVFKGVCEQRDDKTRDIMRD